MTLSDFYKNIFGEKTYKLSLDAGCTCPNRDGTKGRGGCIFCSENGSGDFASSSKLTVSAQIENAKFKVVNKIKGRTGERKGKYIAYFQNFSSTYGDEETLLKKYKEALLCDGVEGLAVATRPDCLSDRMILELARIAEKHFVQLELGLQTSNEKTASFINRCCTNEDYVSSVERIRKASPKIHIVTHLIFGLPGENRDDMEKSVRFVLAHNDGAVFGLKITVLYVLKNTPLEKLYKSGEYLPLEKEEYYELLKNALTLLPPQCILHRLTGDPPKSSVIAPLWTLDKKKVINEIHSLLKEIIL